MAAPVFLAALLILLSSSSASASRSLSPSTAITANTEFIRTSCSSTTYPKLCYASLSVHTSKIQSSAKLLATTALDVTLTSTKSTSAAMSQLFRAGGVSRQDVATMRDCVEEMRDSVDKIRCSMDEMSSTMVDFRMMINDVQRWVSVVLTDERTCMEGFGTEVEGGGEDVKKAMRGKVENMAHLTSNALALINAYAQLSS